MTDTDPHPHQIEDQLARDRAALTNSINALRNRLSADHVVTDVLGLIKSHPATYTTAIDKVVRANPMALAVVGAGLAWLLLGRTKTQAAAPCGEVLSGTKYEALSRWEDEGGPAVPLEDPDLKWVAQSEDLRSRASAALAQLEEMARARLASAGEVAQERAAILAGLAKDVRAAMREGLEQLSTAAQDRIVAAREAAYAAQLNARKATGKMIEDHPMATAGIALALGVAVGAALPRTRTEDKILGPERDRLLAETRRMLAEERLRAIAAAELLADGWSQRV